MELRFLGAPPYPPNHMVPMSSTQELLETEMLVGQFVGPCPTDQKVRARKPVDTGSGL